MTQSRATPETERQIAELAAVGRMLDAARGTFSLSIAVCNSVPLRDYIIDKLTASDSGIGVIRIPKGSSDVLRVAKREAGKTKPSAILLLDLDIVVPSDDQGLDVLAALNASRELWAERFSCPVVFWVPEYLAVAISIHARDLWAWKSHQFEFVPEAAVITSGRGDLPSINVDVAANLDVERKRFRIAELEQRLAETDGDALSQLARHRLVWLHELALLCWFVGKTDEALALGQKALDEARALKDEDAEAAARLHLGHFLRGLGRTRQAIREYEGALVIRRGIGGRRGEAHALGGLGNAYVNLGEPRRAIEHYEQGLAISREIGDRRGEGQFLGGLGIAYADLGETRRAIDHHEQALAIDREIGERRGEGQDLGNLGSAYATVGETRRATECYEQQLVIAREIGYRRGEANALGNLGNACADLGETRPAIEYYEQALAIAREIGDRRGEGTDLWNMSLALRKLGDKAKAVSLCEQALEILEQIEDPNAAKTRRALEAWRNET